MKKFKKPTFPDSPIFRSWCNVAMISIITLVSAASLGVDNLYEIWVTAAAAVSLSISLLVFCGYNCLRNRFEGSGIEGFLALIVLIAWTACIPATMHITTESGGYNNVVNANLYFSTWLSFAVSVSLFIQSLPQLVGEGRAVPEESTKMTRLVGLVVTSVVLLVSSSQFALASCGGEGGSTCQRNSYAIYVGAVGTALPCVTLLLLLCQRLNMIIEMIISIFMFITYIFGVGFITFGDGPGSLSISNLYFAPWVGFVLSSSLAFESIKNGINRRGKNDEEEYQESALPPLREDAAVDYESGSEADLDRGYEPEFGELPGPTSDDELSS
mmetsp:Transcript_20013/g.30088  ORF Transcript_20013/g.30088 Transcript_20013/m.30088 type:complete len:328 (+) Transcript_20013:211-1194(+)|eukprot:CAMPEP_0178903386 /NCGR_PEP_ID=MMETSP0786-20121207/5127_1 /TAXON_ID=186022 /ORGANISM="Thalassionema frauenfeldii, Strain CCMP 1798" /LENGTH=327 /DNA_ID=CAMNT_0020574749 /DNA_START=125 /DNA_END=1108 /DNA_ORIENTATION=-